MSPMSMGPTSGCSRAAYSRTISLSRAAATSPRSTRFSVPADTESASLSIWRVSEGLAETAASGHRSYRCPKLPSYLRGPVALLAVFCVCGIRHRHQYRHGDRLPEVHASFRPEYVPEPQACGRKGF